MKNILFLKKIVIIIFVSLNFNAFAQIMKTDESEIQNPLKQVESSFYPNFKKPIKSFIYMVDKDTISKSSFDKNGNEISRIEFESNKPFYNSVNEFKGKLLTETKFYIKNILTNTTNYKYDKKNNLIDWQSIKSTIDKKNGKPILTNDIHWVLEYDQNNKSTKKYSLNAQNLKTQSYDYVYDSSSKLIETNEEQWKDKYENENNLITKKSRIFKSDNSVYSFTSYTYNSEKLLSESSYKYKISKFIYESSKPIKLNYQYLRDNTSQDINLFYKNNLLNKVEIATNGFTYFEPPFIFKCDYLGMSWKKNEINNLTMEFVYDKFNNTKEIKYFIADKYQYSKYFVISYY